MSNAILTLTQARAGGAEVAGRSTRSFVVVDVALAHCPADVRPTMYLYKRSSSGGMQLVGQTEVANAPAKVLAKDTARQTLEAMQPALQHVTIRALGYRDDMFELMQIADAIVARPGTGTTSEAIMAACPLLLNTLGGIMPQEWITVKYLRAQGMPAQRLKKPADLARQIQQLTSHPQQLAALKQTMIALQPSGRPADIIDDLVELARR